jgi:hypothetical protein
MLNRKPRYIFACSVFGLACQLRFFSTEMANKKHFLPGCVLALLMLVLSGCQPKVYMMPPPLSVKSDSSFFHLTEDNKDGNLLYTLFATNRIPGEPGIGSGYTIFPSDILKLGFVVHRVGDEGMSWEDLQQESLKKQRNNKLLIRQVHSRKMTEYALADDLKGKSSSAEGFFDQINSILAGNYNKDILVYVHGANSNFYRATAQGAQIYHFTGHNSLLLTFSWPSAENIFKYKTDVLHAKQTVPAFARLLELLANHTEARNINIVAYSAGAQVAVPALVYLRKQYPELSAAQLRTKLRIGEFYLAAPDISFSSFIQSYLKIKDMVERTTINLNLYDSTLRLSAFQNGVTRLGSPDIESIGPEEQQLMLAAMNSPKLNILNVGDSGALKLGGSHNSWYSHPWVSNDLLLLLLFNAEPLQRGLQEYVTENKLRYYLFPDDYQEKITALIAEGQRKLDEQHKPLESSDQTEAGNP